MSIITDGWRDLRLVYSRNVNTKWVDGKHGAGVPGYGARGTGSRGVENTGCGKRGVWKTRGQGGKHGVWWKTRGLSAKHGFLMKKHGETIFSPKYEFSSLNMLK